MLLAVSILLLGTHPHAARRRVDVRTARRARRGRGRRVATPAPRAARPRRRNMGTADGDVPGAPVACVVGGERRLRSGGMTTGITHVVNAWARREPAVWGVRRRCSQAEPQGHGGADASPVGGRAFVRRRARRSNAVVYVHCKGGTARPRQRWRCSSRWIARPCQALAAVPRARPRSTL